LTALCDHGHFGRAAEACHVTQSTLSASIKELESILQVALVDRSKRRVVLTPVGVEAVDRARKIVKEIDELVSFTNASRDRFQGRCGWVQFRPSGHFYYHVCCPAFARRMVV
jgi:LysR family transcriptional regulator, hydrogen peroxide-inducible genes activator